MKRTGSTASWRNSIPSTTLVAAANRTREAGYRKIDAYSPFPD